MFWEVSKSGTPGKALLIFQGLREALQRSCFLLVLGVVRNLEPNSSRYLASRGCYSTPCCGKAGERAGSSCAIDVEGHKRRPPSKVGGLCHEFWVLGFGFRVSGLGFRV